MPPLRFACAALLPIFPVLAHSQSRIWEANMAEPAGALPSLFRQAPDTSLIPYPTEPFRAALESRAAWDGVLQGEKGDSKFEIAGAQATQTLWATVLPRTVAGVIWTGSLTRNRSVEPGRLDAGIGIARNTLGMIWAHRLMASAEAAPGSAKSRFLDAVVWIPDRDRQAFAWMLAAGRGNWRVEYGLRQDEIEEDISITNLDSAGGGENVRGVYRTREQAHRIVVKAPAAKGSLSLAAAYARGLPRHPSGEEFWFCDSSRRVEAYLAYSRPWRRLHWRAWGEFKESESYSLGRRIPPGSEGLKRFHFARNHALAWESGGEAEIQGAYGAWNLGGRYRRFDGDSRPPDDALNSRRETLAYNRLGLSFIANLYGGLYKISDLLEADASVGLWEAEGGWENRYGPFSLQAGFSLFRADFDVFAIKRTVSQRITAFDTSISYRRDISGYLAGVTPRIRAGMGRGRFAIEIEAAQALPLFAEIRENRPAGPDPGPMPGAPSEPETRYRAFRNGFYARAGLKAGF